MAVIEVLDVKKSFRVYSDKGKTLKEKMLFQKRNQYEERLVLNGISFQVEKGEAVGLIGHNGCGKSTLGKTLARKLHFHFIDNEDLYFSKMAPNYIYTSPRTREEVEKLLWSEIRAHEDFVFASVKGDYGETIYPFFQYAVLIDVPKDIRIWRVRNRSFQKFGERMLIGGDLHEHRRAGKLPCA